ncbi:hypothetical protein XH80_06935 [Bradyrhizobium sp. CCBAU 45384]|nr:hypothetical protein [Bradyrhizobium sp. CCBAU 45384]
MTGPVKDQRDSRALASPSLAAEHIIDSAGEHLLTLMHIRNISCKQIEHSSAFIAGVRDAAPSQATFDDGYRALMLAEAGRVRQDRKKVGVRNIACTLRVPLASSSSDTPSSAPTLGEPK